MTELLHGDGAIRRTTPYGSSIENTYAGVLSFMRRNYSRVLDGIDVAISGVPLDLATTYRSGARLGPAAIRAASVQLAELNPYPWGFNPFDDLAAVDYGDCWFDAHNPLSIKPAIVEHARAILRSGAKMLTLGGDHYITYPLLVAHAERYGQPLSLIHFDAHCDTWADDDPDSLNHGTMFYKAVKEGLIDPATSVQVGIRTWNDDFLGIERLDAAWVHDQGARAAVERIVAIVGARPAYLTFDIDCLDPAFAPGTGTPVAGGLSSAQALAIVRGARGGESGRGGCGGGGAGVRSRGHHGDRGRACGLRSAVSVAAEEGGGAVTQVSGHVMRKAGGQLPAVFL